METQEGHPKCSYTSYSDMTRDTIDAEQASCLAGSYTHASIVTTKGLERMFCIIEQHRVLFGTAAWLTVPGG